MRLPGFCVAALLLAWLAPVQASANPVLLISLDGLRADDSRDAKHMPTLAALRREGSWAEEVRGVWPSLTYPAHTTLVTGVSPARHGIGGNLAFDPMGTNQEGWMWFAEDIKVDTLWSAARRAGLKTAAINWPVTVGAPIDFNLPQIWRSRTQEDAGLARAVATPGLAARLQGQAGAPYPLGSDGTCEADAIRARYAGALIASEHPALTAVHLECLDHRQHDFGPGSTAADEARVRLDAIVAALVNSARASTPGLAVAIVSDHGFAPVHTSINLDAAFRDAGLVVTDTGGNVTAWRAAPWTMSGTAAVVLHDPADRSVRLRTEALLARLARDKRLGIERVVGGVPADETGGTATAAYWIVFRPGYAAGGYRSGPLVQSSEIRGTHGYPPDRPDMMATFILSGAHIAHAGSLGMVDMRSIAPMLAAIIGVELANAEGMDRHQVRKAINAEQ